MDALQGASESSWGAGEVPQRDPSYSICIKNRSACHPRPEEQQGLLTHPFLGALDVPWSTLDVRTGVGFHIRDRNYLNSYQSDQIAPKKRKHTDRTPSLPQR